MREILFRGKKINDGIWICGGFCHGNNRNESIICPKYDFSQEVIPETVGQYTGLTDKNGKKIFEGDIVSGLFLHSSPVNGVVAFRDGSFGLLWSRAGAETFWAFTSICNVEYEVIGNIHDNPELLKGGETNGK